MADPYSLDLVANEPYRRGFRYKIDGVGKPLAGYSWGAQARRKEAPDAQLIRDLTEYLTLDVDDDTVLRLNIPGSVTREIGLTRLPASAYWDLFIWPTVDEDDATLLVQGPVTIDRATTDLR